jgi:hypothetical protein
MNRHRRIIAVMASLLWASRALAQTDDAPPARVDVVYASSHVFRGVERARDSAQATLELNREALRGGLWINQPFKGGDPSEVNLNAAYTWTTSNDVTLEASATHAWFAGVPGVDRSLEVGLVTTLAPAGGFTPSLAYYHDFRFDADTIEVSFARSIALTKLGAFLELSFCAGLASGTDWRPEAAGPRLKDRYGYWGGEVRLPYRVGPHSTVVAGVHYSGNSGRSIAAGAFGGPVRDRLWVTLGVNLDF